MSDLWGTYVRDGIRYRLSEKTRVGWFSRGYQGDFDFLEEEIHQMPKSKAWCLVGYGGANSKYRRALDGNTWTGGKGFQALAPTQALAWCEAHLEAEAYENRFPDLIRDAE